MNNIQKEAEFRMPAEWEKHSAVWLAWPYDKITFGSLNQKDNKIDVERMAKVEKTFLKIINILQESEQVKLIVRNKNIHPGIGANVETIEADYADVWTRDYLPSFIKDKNGGLVAKKWIYNAYGEKFNSLIKDNYVWSEINKKLNIRTITSKIVIEPGAIDVNGNGVLLTTEQCMLTRNPSLTKIEIENTFARILGITKIIWLKRGLVNDHTDGHIDEIARFVGPSKILCAYEDDSTDKNFKILDDNYNFLKNSVNENDELFEVVKLPMPHMIYNNGKTAPVSYTNFYIGNKTVLVSLFNDPNDEKAMSIIKSCFPDRDVVGIDCTELIYGGGALHCITQQEPAV